MKKSLSVFVVIICALSVVSAIAVSAEENYSTKVLLTVEETICTATEPQQNIEITTTVAQTVGYGSVSVSNDLHFLQTGTGVNAHIMLIIAVILWAVVIALWFSRLRNIKSKNFKE